MSSLLTGTPVTYSGQQATEYVLRPAIATGKIEDFFKVVFGVKTKQQVIFLSPINKITQADTGCGSVGVTPAVTRTEKFWLPDSMKAWVQQCWKDVVGTLEESWLKAGNDKSDLTGTKVEEYMLDLLTPAAYRDYMRLAWLGKKTIVAGELTGGSADVANYSSTDGMWKRILDGVASSLIPRTTITENAGSAGAQTIASGSARTYFQSVFKKADPLLKQADVSTKVLFVTRGVYEDYEADLESKGTLETSFAKLQDGQTVLTYRGVQLHIVDILDQFISSDFNLSGVYTAPNRVVLTVKDNLQIGLDGENSDPSSMEIWYERNTELWNARLKYKLATMIADERYVSVAY